MKLKETNYCYLCCLIFLKSKPNINQAHRVRTVMQNYSFLKEVNMKLEMGKYLLILKLVLVLKKCLRRLLEYKLILILKKEKNM